MAITTIPWNDGSGDNIYVSAPSQTGSQTVTVSSDENKGSSDRTKTVTFTAKANGQTVTKILTLIQAKTAEQYIVFADPVVEQICATNWGDGTGIKPSQAARVTNSQFGTTFRANTTIASFDELSYFTGLTQVPGGATSSGAFYGCTALTSVTLSSTITTLAAYCFRGCSNLASCPDLSNITTIGAQAFYQCSRMTGTATIPSSVTSVGSLVFAGCHLIKDLTFNTTINITTQSVSNTTDATSCGDGTGTFYCAGNLTNTSNYRAYFRKYIIGGNYTQTGGRSNPWRVKVVNNSWPTEVFVVKGNYQTNGTDANSSALIGPALNATAKLKFVEIMGTITSDYCILNYNNRTYMAEGFILHLGYDAYANGRVVCTPTIAGASYSRVSKIYVGKGASASEDNNILSVYLADSAWSAYSAKLDTWYNYVNSSNANSDFIN